MSSGLFCCWRHTRVVAVEVGLKVKRTSSHCVTKDKSVVDVLESALVQLRPTLCSDLFYSNEGTFSICLVRSKIIEHSRDVFDDEFKSKICAAGFVSEYPSSGLYFQSMYKLLYTHGSWAHIKLLKSSGKGQLNTLFHPIPGEVAFASASVSDMAQIFLSSEHKSKDNIPYTERGELLCFWTLIPDIITVGRSTMFVTGTTKDDGSYGVFWHKHDASNKEVASILERKVALCSEYKVNNGTVSICSPLSYPSEVIGVGKESSFMEVKSSWCFRVYIDHFNPLFKKGSNTVNPLYQSNIFRLIYDYGDVQIGNDIPLATSLNASIERFETKNDPLVSSIIIEPHQKHEFLSVGEINTLIEPIPLDQSIVFNDSICNNVDTCETTKDNAAEKSIQRYFILPNKCIVVQHYYALTEAEAFENNCHVIIKLIRKLSPHFDDVQLIMSDDTLKNMNMRLSQWIIWAFIRGLSDNNSVNKIIVLGQQLEENNNGKLILKATKLLNIKIRNSEIMIGKGNKPVGMSVVVIPQRSLQCLYVTLSSGISKSLPACVLDLWNQLHIVGSLSKSFVVVVCYNNCKLNMEKMQKLLIKFMSRDVADTALTSQKDWRIFYTSSFSGSQLFVIERMHHYNMPVPSFFYATMENSMLKKREKELPTLGISGIAGIAGVAVIVEPRRHIKLSYVVHNVLKILPNKWIIKIYHGNGNKEWILSQDLLQSGFIEGKIIIHELDVANLNGYTYSDILKSERFWRDMPAENVLVFQTDSILCSGSNFNISSFMHLSYVGSFFVWPRHISRNLNGDRGGNGGFSFRRRSSMLRVIRERPPLPTSEICVRQISMMNTSEVKEQSSTMKFEFSRCYEDVYFVMGIHSIAREDAFNGLDNTSHVTSMRLASVVDAQRFGIQYHFDDNLKQFGIHKMEVHFDATLQKRILEYCPEYTEILNIEHDLKVQNVSSIVNSSILSKPKDPLHSKKKSWMTILECNSIRYIRAYNMKETFPATIRPTTLVDGVLTQKKMSRRPRVIEMFTFNNEFLMLEAHLDELASVVDVFVIAEATTTFQGKAKRLWFTDLIVNKEDIPKNIANTGGNLLGIDEEGRNRLIRFLPQIRVVSVSDMPICSSNVGAAWSCEYWQRNALQRGIPDLLDDDIVIISDVDEIVRSRVVTAIRDCSIALPATLSLQFHYYSVNWRKQYEWGYPNVVWGKELRNKTPQQIRSLSTWRIKESTTKKENAHTEVQEMDYDAWRQTCKIKILDAGWHFSYFMTPPGIIDKIHSFAHTEFVSSFTDDENSIEKLVKSGRDIFNRNTTNKNGWTENLERTPEERLKDLPKFFIKYKHNRVAQFWS